MGQFEISQEQVWAIIPARGGSKSIPLKNLVTLGGHPLIEYVILAARASRRLTRVICSTDSDPIAALCHKHEVEVHGRPQELSGDDVPVLQVLQHLVGDLGSREGKIADILCLLQPTSPFVLPDDIDSAVSMLERDAQADSVQTVTHFPHNFHAYNQRFVQDGRVRFMFPAERRRYYNKQTKPPLWIFGNLVATRSSTILEKGDIFGDQSLARKIPPFYATDIDRGPDVELAEWLLTTGKVRLPHIDSGSEKASHS